jgi:hypothetical protein
MTRFPLFLLGLLISIVFVPGCKTGTESTEDSDCGDSKSVCMHANINSSGNFFILETPEARNDCEATYFYYFRWADPLRRAAEVSGHEEMPPIDDFGHAFQPGGEFAYFPHPNASYEATSTIQDCSGNVIPGQGWWVVRFSIGNKNSGNPTTRYYVRSRLNPGTAGSLDETEIVCKIVYYDKPAKSGN